MNRYYLSMTLTACLAAVFAPAAQAITLFFDRGDVTTGVLGGPVDGSTPQITLAAGGTATLHLWAIPDAATDRHVVSLGFDVIATGAAAGGVSAVALVMDNPSLPSRSANTRWTALALTGGLNQGAKLVADQRAVYVPVQAGHFAGGLNVVTAASRDGYDPNSGAIHLGRLTVAAGTEAAAGTVELRIAVSPLLIANATLAGITQPEPLRLGYAAGSAEPATGDGWTAGATSAQADATVQLVTAIPGDGDADGDVDLQDYQAFVDCLNGPDRSPAQPAGCLAPFDFNQDGDVDLADAHRFLQSFSLPAR